MTFKELLNRRTELIKELQHIEQEISAHEVTRGDSDTNARAGLSGSNPATAYNDSLNASKNL